MTFVKYCVRHRRCYVTMNSTSPLTAGRIDKGRYSAARAANNKDSNDELQSPLFDPNSDTWIQELCLKVTKFIVFIPKHRKTIERRKLRDIICDNGRQKVGPLEDKILTPNLTKM